MSATRVLVLGAMGMLGHKLVQVLSAAHEVAATVREPRQGFAVPPSLASAQLFHEVSATRLETLERVMEVFAPHAVLNCVGVIKQLEAARDAETAIALNALFPHQVGRLADQGGARVIHFSTDCVFSGEKGVPYREDDRPDATDLYGRSKLLGELTGERHLTLRTSIIGRELRGRRSLVEWAINQRGRTIQGYARALYTGLPTIELATLVTVLLDDFPALAGLWHVGSHPISKYALLGLLNEAYDLHLDIERDDSYCCDRRLDSGRFRAETGYAPPSWPQLVAQMATDAPMAQD
jgi:dTDP-4-dehydrorhamnose reductase